LPELEAASCKAGRFSATIGMHLMWIMLVSFAVFDRGQDNALQHTDQLLCGGGMLAASRSKTGISKRK